MPPPAQYPRTLSWLRLNDDLRRCLNPLTSGTVAARLTIASPPFAGSAKGATVEALLARQQRPSFRQHGSQCSCISPAGHICRAVNNSGPFSPTMPNCPRGIYPPLSTSPQSHIPMMENHPMASSLYVCIHRRRLLTRHAFRQFCLSASLLTMPSFSSNQETPDFRSPADA